MLDCWLRVHILNRRWRGYALKWASEHVRERVCVWCVGVCGVVWCGVGLGAVLHRVRIFTRRGHDAVGGGVGGVTTYRVSTRGGGCTSRTPFHRMMAHRIGATQYIKEHPQVKNRYWWRVADKRVPTGGARADSPPCQPGSCPRGHRPAGRTHTPRVLLGLPCAAGSGPVRDDGWTSGW